MSSSASSSSSHSQRSPLHERPSSEQNKLQIRVVPYSPPRLEADEGKSHVTDTGAEHHGAHDTANDDPISGSSTRTPFYGKEAYFFDHASATSLLSPSLSPSPSASSSTSPTTSWARFKGKGVSGSKLASDSSDAEHTAPPTPALNRASYGSNITRINAPSQPIRRDDGSGPSSPGPGPAPVSPSWSQSSSRTEKVINVHSDKTFSVVLKPTRARNSDKAGSSLKSPSVSNTSTVSSHERISFDAPADDHPSSPLSSIAERSTSSDTPGPSAAPTEFPEDHTTSPWNYRIVGGLRKVPKTPEVKSKGKEKEVATPALPPLPETEDTLPEPSPRLLTKPSFATELSDSTIEETTNYKIIGRSSPLLSHSDSFDVRPSSSSGSANYNVLGQSSPNLKVLGQSSPAQHFVSSPTPGYLETPGSKNLTSYDDSSPTPGYLETPGSKNFIVYDDSPSSSFAFTRRPRRHSSDDSLGQELREKYSQESLLIPPLRPRRSSEIFGFHRSKSKSKLKESPRGRANSLSSIASVITQDTPSLSTPNIVRLGSTPSTSSTPHFQQVSWARPSSAVSNKAQMEQHQWSTQLSTVASEYEGSDRGSRVISGVLVPDRGSSAFGDRGSSAFGDRGSSAFGSRNSRQWRSISSSVHDNLQSSSSHSRSHSGSDSLDRPAAAFMRGARELPSPPLRTVRDHDEDGDGLADLRQLNQLQNKPSRSRLGFLSHKSSDRSLRSSGSGSMTTSSIPAWARLYYGSGERRWLAAPSLRSDGGDSRPGSSWAAPSGSPSHEQFAQNIVNPRRRPKEMRPLSRRPTSMEITTGDIDHIRRGPTKKSSSIWSPHLRMDHRASRYSIWEPPSVSWSAESGMFGKRNVQVVLFALGFGFPFAWMIAALLPLPPKPASLEMGEQGRSTMEFRIPEEPKPLPQRVAPVDDSRFQSARWWRNLNRFMSIAGLLILGAVAALAVIGTRQRWGK